MDKRWMLKEKTDTQVIEELSRSLNISKRLTSLLMHRGVSTFDEAKRFFRPELKDLHDPFLMKDMDKAVNRIIKAMDNGEKIMIFGDFDVDGSDLSIFALAFGTTDCNWWPPLCECDFDGDGDVDGSDLAVFAADFGRTDCP